MNENVPIIDPRHTMLLVMDYQSAILNNLPDSSELLSRTTEAMTLARSRGVHIGYVWVAFSDADYDAIPKTNKGFSAVAGSRRLALDSPDSAIHPAVAPESGDLIVRKTRVGAFSTTDLAQQLREREIDTLILAGVTTSGVVLSTVRDAADHDYRLYVLEDGCADRTPEVHDLLMQKVFPNQAYVISVDELPIVLGD
ncbi:isochorismatase family protein YecD [Abditibacteriota bacterium]|nr:isochorismatase family protein YecD [Abditibacteriota bacterium]